MGLLKGIDPLLTADLLHVLRSMGHGDKLCVCDANFPAAEVAAHTASKKCIVLTVPTVPQALEAILSVLPLDHFLDHPARYMAPQEGVALPPAGVKVTNEIRETVTGYAPLTAAPLERFAFYEEARTCFAVVQTLERRPYGNVILAKGVIGPDGNDLMP